MIDLLFILMAVLGVMFAGAVVSFSNPVYSVLSLIMVFLCVSCTFLLIKVDFIAMALITLYLGAVVVLFLFVVMMIIDERKYAKRGKVYLFSSLLLVGSLGTLVISSIYNHPKVQMASLAEEHQWIKRIGLSAFDTFGPEFVLFGMMLVVSVVGAIALTAEKRPDIKKIQRVDEQLSRSNLVDRHSVGLRQGVSWK